MRPNPLMSIALVDRQVKSPGYCRDCGSSVSRYNANRTLKSMRAAINEDWWEACDNADCRHSYGEGVQGSADWVQTPEMTAEG